MNKLLRINVIPVVSILTFLLFLCIAKTPTVQAAAPSGCYQVISYVSLDAQGGCRPGANPVPEPGKCYQFVNNPLILTVFTCTDFDSCPFSEDGRPKSVYIATSKISCSDYKINYVFNPEKAEAIRKMIAAECKNSIDTAEDPNVKAIIEANCKHPEIGRTETVYDTCSSDSTSLLDIYTCINSTMGYVIFTREDVTGENPPEDTPPEDATELPDANQTIANDDDSQSLHSGDAAVSGTFYNFIIISLRVIGAMAGIAIVGSLVFSGVQYTTAGDNSGALSKAKTRIAYTLITLVVYIMVYYVAIWLIPS